MLYDILALLWDAPRDDAAIARDLAERTGQPPETESVDGTLWLLTQLGFVSVRGHRDHPVYALAESGSALLARAATTYSRSLGEPNHA
jgi:DNA-binding PadR family transcriptional regulator